MEREKGGGRKRERKVERERGGRKRERGGRKREKRE